MYLNHEPKDCQPRPAVSHVDCHSDCDRPSDTVRWPGRGVRVLSTARAPQPRWPGVNRRPRRASICRLNAKARAQRRAELRVRRGISYLGPGHWQSLIAESPANRDLQLELGSWEPEPDFRTRRRG